VTGIARDPALDGSLALLREGYRFIGNRCRRLETDAFETRLAGRKTVCVLGPEAAAVFYDASHMERHGAAPACVRRTLLGRGGVQGLDGERHRRRKAMFMALMTPPRIAQLSRLFADELQRAADRWTRKDRVVLHGEMQQALCVEPFVRGRVSRCSQTRCHAARSSWMR
jgi:fatty-acid peroxygenase